MAMILIELQNLKSINSSLTIYCAKLVVVSYIFKHSFINVIMSVELARDPKECDYCDKLFCKLCIENWLLLNRNCPMCHKDIKIRGASRVVKEIINSFKIKCSFCPAIVNLTEIEKHESVCGQISCDNPLCGK